MTGLTLVALVTGLMAGGLAAREGQPEQARPDFSGRWTTDPDPAAVPAGRAAGAGQRGRGAARGDMGSGWGSTMTVTQDAARLVVEYAFFARGDMQPPLRFTYALDGSPSTNTVMMGRGMQTQVSRATWDGQALVIDTAHTFTDPGTGQVVPAPVRQRLSLESPASLVVETTRAGVLGAAATTTRSVYRRVS